MYCIEFTPETQKLYEELNRGFVAAHAVCSEDVKTAFEAQAVRTPERVALRCGANYLTYAELNARAEAISGALHQAGLRPGKCVLVDIARSLDLVVALLGVVKCGAVYVPLGSGWPASRVALLAEETSAQLMLSDGDSFAILPQGVQLLDLTGIDKRLRAPEVMIKPEDVMYVNFTSGSTGKPKAVPILHAGVIRLVRDMAFLPECDPLVTLHLSPIAFDAATFEIWAPLVNGGTCVVYPEKDITITSLQKTLCDGSVNTLFLTTALFNTILDVSPQALDSVDTILTGGEAHSVRHIAAAVERYGAERVVSVYGPTECTTFSSFHPINTCPSGGTIPLGTPIQKTGIYVLDGRRACKVGECGTIHITGPGLSPGYLNAPEKTARHFKRLTIHGKEAIAYDTGDLGRLSPSNEILFEGRTDDQVKINGHRIELGEISYHLNVCVQVRQSVVMVNTTTAGEKQLIAFVIPSVSPFDMEEVSSALGRKMPSYMVPRILTHEGDFPLTATNKIDRAKLLESLSVPETRMRKSARKVQNVLDQKGVKATVKELPTSTRTARDAAHALNCEIGQIVKTLVFCSDFDEAPVIALISGQDTVDIQKLSHLIGTPVERASAKYVKDNIGFAIGGVPPVGHATKTRIIVDEKLSEHDGIWAAAGTPNAVFFVPGSITSVLDDFVVAQIRAD
jgi:amino acid adenylation domain-containing protein